MVQAWYMVESEDKHAPNHKSPPEYISLDELCKKTGVKYYQMNVATYQQDGSLDAFRSGRSFSFEDEITCSRDLSQDMMQHFWKEHLHTDEEIRLVLAGSAYFDVRDELERWVRIQLEPGDLLVLPSGCYHRFTLDSHHYVKLRRFHMGEPAWRSYTRPGADTMPCRGQYVQRVHAAQAC